MSGLVTLVVTLLLGLDDSDGAPTDAVWVMATIGALLVVNSLVLLVVESQVRAEVEQGRRPGTD